MTQFTTFEIIDDPAGVAVGIVIEVDENTPDIATARIYAADVDDVLIGDGSTSEKHYHFVGPDLSRVDDAEDAMLIAKVEYVVGDDPIRWDYSIDFNTICVSLTRKDFKRLYVIIEGLLHHNLVQGSIPEFEKVDGKVS